MSPIGDRDQSDKWQFLYIAAVSVVTDVYGLTCESGPVNGSDTLY